MGKKRKKNPDKDFGLKMCELDKCLEERSFFRE